MQILLDHMIPHRLRHDIEGEVFTTKYVGWDELENGDLLKACDERGIEVMVTHDKGLQHQQDLERYRLAVIQLDALSNDPEDLRPLVPKVNEALQDIGPGEFVVIG